MEAGVPEWEVINSVVPRIFLVVVIFLILYCYLIYIYQYFVCLHDGVTKIDSKKMFKNYIHCYVCFFCACPDGNSIFEWKFM